MIIATKQIIMLNPVMLFACLSGSAANIMTPVNVVTTSCLVHSGALDDFELSIFVSSTGEVHSCDDKYLELSEPELQPKKPRLDWLKFAHLQSAMSEDSDILDRAANFIRAETMSEIQEAKENLDAIENLNIATDLYFVLPSGKVFELYKPFNGPVTANLACDGCREPMMGKLDRRSADLTGLHLRVAIEPFSTFAILGDEGDLESGRATGIFPDVFLEIQRALNFSYSMHRF